MAGANLPAKKYKKTSPTQLRLCFESTGNDRRYIDISRALSIINRKFYRQGVYYYVNSIEFWNNSDTVVDVYSLPDTLVTKNSWNRAFSIFQEMNAQTDVPRPKYHDFKVRFDVNQEEDLSNTMDPDTYGPYDVANNRHTHNSHGHDEDLWFSRFTTMLSDGGLADEFTGHMLGPQLGSGGNITSVGLIESYGNSRREPDQSGDPILPASLQTDPLNNLFDASGDGALADIMENLDTYHDETPYNADYYIGEDENDMQHVARLATVSTSHRVDKAPGFCVPFGLLCIDPNNVGENDDYTIVLNLAAGTYHGVYAERA